MRGDRKLSAVRIAGLLVVVLLVASPIPRVAAGVHVDTPHPVAPALEGQTSPALDVAGVDADWWSPVQEEIRRTEYQVTWQEQTYLDDVPAAYQAPNRAQNLRTYFTSDGLVVIPRVWTEETDVPPWRWQIRLVAWGRADALDALLPGALRRRLVANLW